MRTQDCRTEVSDLIGVPFVYNGRDEKAGLDCYGCARVVYERMTGILPIDFATPSDGNPDACSAAVLAQMNKYWRKVSGPAKGVFVVFVLPGYLHIALCLDEDRFIHAWRDTNGVTIEDLSGSWERRILGYYRYVV